MNNKTFWAIRRREMERRAANEGRPVRRVRTGATRRARPEDRTAEERPYRELQAEAKELGIPANQSREALESAVTEAESAGDATVTVDVDETSGDPDTDDA